MRGGRAAVIVPVSAMIGKTKDDKIIKREILKRHTLEGVINLNRNTFYRIGTVPCAAVFTAGVPHSTDKLVKFINFEDDGFEVKKHVGLVETERAKDRKQYLLDCWRGLTDDVPSKFMVETTVEDGDEWLHSFYYYNDELPTAADFEKTVADYLTFEFNMIVHGRGYLFGVEKKNEPLSDEEPPLPNPHAWKNFSIDELFRLESGRCSQSNRLRADDRGVPYVGATNRNNGVLNIVAPVEEMIQNGNCIAFIKQGEGSVGYSVYKAEKFIASTSVALGYAPFLNRYVGTFITTIADKVRGKYSFNYPRSEARLRNELLQLPATADGEPDFEFMEKFMRARESRLLRQYLEKLRAEDFSEIEAPPALSDQTWRAFYIEEVAEISSGRDIYEDERREGATPYIGASAANNGITHFVGNVNETLEARCISVNRNGSVGYAFYHPYFALYSNDCRKLRPKIDDEFVSIFIAHQITAQRDKYSYGYKMGTGRLRRQRILLPTTADGAPDFEYMSSYIKHVRAELLLQFQGQTAGT